MNNDHPTPAPFLHVHFEIDGLYFAEASRRAEPLPTLQRAYATKAAEVELLNRQISEIEARYGGASAAAYDETEHLVIGLVDSVFVELDAAARPLAGTSAIIQILCAACLEAHINVRAAETLPGATYKEFERIGLGGKWLMYPRLRGLTGLEASDAVMGRVQALVKRRNMLAHPKQWRVREAVGFKNPSFLEELGLTAAAAQEAVACTRAAVLALAAAEGRVEPGWASDTLWQLFRHHWQRD